MIGAMAERKSVHLQFQGDNTDGKSEDRAMPPVLVPIMAVGMTSLPGGVCLLGKDTVVYPVGRSLALYCPSQLSTVRISEPLRAVRGITALTLAPNKKFLAAAESMAEGYLPQVTLFDAITLERSLTLTGTPSTGTFTHLAFSADSSLLLATASEEGSGSAPPTSTFHLWEWASSTTPRCSGSLDRGEMALRAALDPRYDANVLVMCTKSVGLFRQSPNGFKRHPVEGLEMARDATFVDLATLSDGRFLVAASSRQVFLVDRTHAHLAFYTDRPVICLIGLPDSAVAVGTERGYLQLYRRSANSDTAPYSIYSETRVPENVLSVSLDNHIRAMAVGPSGETLLCATSGGGPTYLFNLAYARTLALSPDPGNDLWEVLLPGCHEQGIISASLAYKRDFLATASKDLTVRVWQTSPLRLVLTHTCHHSPLALSIDPYGRELVVAYVDGVRCYSIVEGLLVEGEELYHEFGPPPAPGTGGAGGGGGGAAGAGGAGSAAAAAAASGGAGGGRRRGGGAAAAGGGGDGKSSLDHCSLVRYSPTGALIAAAGGPGGRHVYIFSTLTKRQLAVLAGHYEAVLDVAWSDDGLYLATAGEGAVFTWAVDGFSRVQENTSKLYLNDAISCTPDFRTLVVGDTTQGLRIIETNRTTGQSDPDAPPDSPRDAGNGVSTGVSGGVASAAAAATAAASPATPGKHAAGNGVSSGGGGGGGGGGSPGGELFRVPGRASLVPIGTEQGAGSAATAHRGGRAMRLPSSLRIDALSGGGGGGGPGGGMVSELKIRSSFNIIQPFRGGLAIARCVAAPSLGTGLGAGYSVILGTGVLGRVRLCPLRPRNNEDVDEYYLHSADVTQVVTHRDGRLVFTTDSSGCWMMHVLMPAATPASWAAALAAASVAAAATAASDAVAVAASPMPGVVASTGPLSPAARSGSPSRQSMAGVGGGLLTAAAGNRSASGLVLGMAGQQLGSHVERTAAAHRLMLLVASAAGMAAGGARHGGAGTGAAAAGGAAGDVSGGGGAPAAQLIVSMRAVDLQSLKESQRELKDRLAKAATEAEYKMYEREQGVRREFEVEVSRLRHEVDVLRADLEYTRTTASDESNAAARLKAAMTADFERALREQQDAFEKKLAAEISRTDAAEREMQRLRAKFGRKLWQLDEQQGTILREAAERQMELEHVIENTKQDAQKAIAAAHIQTEQELRIDGELNEEELQRAADAAQKQLEEKDEAYLKLLAKHTLQSGLNAKTAQESERLRVEAETLRKENTRLAEQVMALSEELEAMQAAWADRDARQRHQDAEMKDLAFQWQQSQLFSTLATSRIKELNNELEPIKASRTEALAHVAQMESVAQRQLERQAKVVSENASLQSRLDAAYEELKKVKGDMLEREAYFKNFTTQLFRTIQDVPHQHWPKLFGRLIDDYHKGRDKAAWTRYLASDHGPNAHPASEEASKASSTAVSDAASTAAEYHEKIAELHAQLMHTEKMLSLLTETKGKADQARRAVVSKLMADNLMAVQELNDVKRDLKSARELAEKRAIELADLRMSLAVAGAVTSQVVSQASNAQLAAAPPPPSTGEGYPQGPAGRAMARLPSRFSDPSRNNGGGGAAEAPAAAAAAGGALHPSSSSTQEPYFSAAAAAPVAAATAAPSSSPAATVAAATASSQGPPQPAMIVTGDMPQGGWWLGENSPFALPASLDHLASSTLRQRAVNSSYDGGGGGGGGMDRPGTGAGLLGRRPVTSASAAAAATSSSGGRFFGSQYSNNSLPGRSTWTPQTPTPGLMPARRPDTTTSSSGGSLVAAAVSGAALQAYKIQQQQQQQQQDGGRASSPTDGGSGGGPALHRSLSPPHASPPHRPEGHQPRATSAGPTSSAAAAAVIFNGNGGGGGNLHHSQPNPSQRTRVRSTSAVPTLSLGAAPYGSGGSLLPPGLTMPFLQGQIRPSTTSKVTTMGAGFRSFVPTQSAANGGGGSRGGGGGGGGGR